MRVRFDQSGFFEQMTANFAMETTHESNGHRPVVMSLTDVLCVQEKRSVGLDGCVLWNGRVLPLNDAGKTNACF